MRPDPLQRVSDAALKMVVERPGKRRVVVVRGGSLQDREIAGFFQICRDSQHEPERVVVEIRANFVVAAFGERLVLVVRATVGELGRRQVEDPLPGASRDHMEEAEQVLVRIAKTHPAANPRFEVRSRAGHVKVTMHWYAFQIFTMRLVCSSGVFTWNRSKWAGPCFHQVSECLFDLIIVEVIFDDGSQAGFIDPVRARRLEFLLKAGCDGYRAGRSPGAFHRVGAKNRPAARRSATIRAPRRSKAPLARLPAADPSRGRVLEKRRAGSQSRPVKASRQENAK